MLFVKSLEHDGTMEEEKEKQVKSEEGQESSSSESDADIDDVLLSDFQCQDVDKQTESESQTADHAN